MSMPAVGEPAPDFTLPSTAGKPVTLSAFRGERNVLLAFFPLAFTSTCTGQMCSFSEDYDRFGSFDTVVLPISCDAVPSLKVFKATEGLSVDFLSDWFREVSRTYGVLIEAKGYPARAYVLIDKEGTVRWTFREAELGHRRENAELLERLAALG